MAQNAAQDLTGRWASSRHGYTIDVTRCAAGWCGVRLEAGQRCGATVLRLGAVASTTPWPMWEGTLELGAGVQGYKVSATLHAASATEPGEIRLMGGTNRPPLPMTRIIPFQDRLARIDDAHCRSEPKTS